MGCGRGREGSKPGPQKKSSVKKDLDEETETEAEKEENRAAEHATAVEREPTVYARTHMLKYGRKRHSSRRMCVRHTRTKRCGFQLNVPSGRSIKNQKKQDKSNR